MPLGLTVKQESYQWADPRFDDFVGVTLKITNIGDEILYELYLGMFLDFDVGPRRMPNYWTDDGAEYWVGEGRPSSDPRP